VEKCLEDLRIHHFVDYFEPIFRINEKVYPRWEIIEKPLRFLSQVVRGKMSLANLEGRAFEEVARSLLTKKLHPAVVYQNVFWAEECTEIDVVAENREQQIVYCGSCKRSCRAQQPTNLLAHVISFFNNRGYSAHYLFNFKHIFLFISPEMDDEHRQEMQNSVQRLNQLLQGDQAQLIQLAREQLSNVFGRGRKFEPKEMPKQLFQVAECRAYQLADLLP
jgi:hypothetical protein